MKGRQIYIGLTLLVIGILYFIYQYDTTLFLSIIDYWPIFIFLSGLFMEIVALNNVEMDFLFILAGMFFIYGIMYTINLYREFYYFSSHISIFSLALSMGFLNYYIFKSKNDSILCFILLLILISIFIFTFPIYEKYFPVVSFKTLLPIILIIIGIILIFNGLINSQQK